SESLRDQAPWVRINSIVFVVRQNIPHKKDTVVLFHQFQSSTVSFFPVEPIHRFRDCIRDHEVEYKRS
ncbi:hypothetical protein KA005_01435, partial [bacterium]|nr:hypothetical protein [bacterium]